MSWSLHDTSPRRNATSKIAFILLLSSLNLSFSSFDLKIISQNLLNILRVENSSSHSSAQPNSILSPGSLWPSCCPLSPLRLKLLLSSTTSISIVIARLTINFKPFLFVSSFSDPFQIERFDSDLFVARSMDLRRWFQYFLSFFNFIILDHSLVV